ncbi:glycosyltransferase, partial [Bifidobacterium sp. M0353]
EFLVIHDDDDAWHRDFLKETVTFLNQNKNSIAVATNYTVVNEEIQKNQAIQINTENWLYCFKQIDIFALLQFNVLPQICLIIR